MPGCSRNISNELVQLELVNKRMNLEEKYRRHYFNLKKGFEGELQFDALTEKLQCDCIILTDLLLEVNNTMFQIDTLIITQRKIYMYEVKNYEGDYYYESEKLYKHPRKEIINPLLQLRRSESLLRQLLSSLGYNLEVSAFIVFINPRFTLYQAPLDHSFIFPTQIDRHMENLNATTSKLTGMHKKVSDQLLALRITNTSFRQLPLYNYEQLQKGILCEKCHAIVVKMGITKCTCVKCGHMESIVTAVVRSVNEYKILFPNEKITTKVVHEWCKAVLAKKTIRGILANNFKVFGAKKWTYYE